MSVVQSKLACLHLRACSSSSARLPCHSCPACRQPVRNSLPAHIVIGLLPGFALWSWSRPLGIGIASFPSYRIAAIDLHIEHAYTVHTHTWSFNTTRSQQSEMSKHALRVSNVCTGCVHACTAVVSTQRFCRSFRAQSIVYIDTTFVFAVSYQCNAILCFVLIFSEMRWFFSIAVVACLAMVSPPPRERACDIKAKP